MRKTLITVMIMTLAASISFSQTRSQKSKSARWAHRQPANPLMTVNRPTRVTGEGVTMPSGVKYWDILPGTGEPAAKGHVVRVLFSAWVENGKQIDGSASADRPTVFTLGVGQVIPGWEEGMEGMKVGGKRQLRIPPELAYGTAGAPEVPPNSALIYDVELLALDQN